ncbi:MAG: PadR family transcriptional regulator [Gemmatimonadetes bacterium]|nr:PadR family transcriptional regulator [Gemmatimonadota bacterium]MBK7715362.1 PadR family transcriptional regulator [Gemmatimonadota bacterium]
MARKAKTRFLVLGLMSQGPRTGYDVAVALREANAFFWHETFSSIYPMLAQLEHEGLIRAKPERRTARKRRSYTITARGRAALRLWLAEPPEPDVVRNELLLKLSFGDATDPAVLAGHVRYYLKRQEAAMTRLDEADSRVAKTPASKEQLLLWRLTVDLGRRVTAARLAWAKEAAARLDRLGG